jgi:nucleoside 2-deoxyribosyltransferase
MLHVAGGTYLERCLFPEWHELFGSGLRASLAAKNLGIPVKFHTYIGSKDTSTLRARTAVTGFDLEIHAETSSTISFDYFHGLSNPIINPPPHLIRSTNSFEISEEFILRFGFMEGDAIVHGKRVVYDPQSPQSPVLFRDNGSTANQLAIVSNRTEGRILTGFGDPGEIAKALSGSQDCAAVVIKCGSHGCVVCEGGSTFHVPAFRTEKVWPIGSGDVFASVFAKFWAVDAKTAAESAELASKATAYFCGTKSLQFPADFPASFGLKPITPREGPAKRVYLAGPFFSMSQNWLIEQALEALSSQGLRVFSPLHHVGRGPANEVYEKDIRGLVESDIVFACVDGLDSGTIFEIGYAKSIGKPVVAFVQNEAPEDLKMLEGSGCVLEKDFVTAIYKTYWLAAA